MPKLNKTRPYGTVHGETAGVSFEQDGNYFNSQLQHVDPETGDRIDSDDDDAEEAPAPAPAAPVAVAPAKGLTVTELGEWGRGAREDFLWGDIKDSLLAHYHRQVDNKRDAVDLLVEVGAVQSIQARKVD